MLQTHSQPGAGDGRDPLDPFEQLIDNARTQYETLHYKGPQSLCLPLDSGPRRSQDRWQWFAAAAVLVAAVAASGLWLPKDPAEPASIRHGSEQARQPSPLAALAAARTVLAAGRTRYPAPDPGLAHAFRFPAAPSRTSGFTSDSEQPS